jgi:hypothetical protein
LTIENKTSVERSDEVIEIEEITISKANSKTQPSSKNKSSRQDFSPDYSIDENIDFEAHLDKSSLKKETKKLNSSIHTNEKRKSGYNPTMSCEILNRSLSASNSSITKNSLSQSVYDSKSSVLFDMMIKDTNNNENEDKKKTGKHKTADFKQTYNDTKKILNILK